MPHKRSSTTQSASPMDEARPFFPGYQEFFFLFLHELPFNFGIHLRGRMVYILNDLLSNLSLDNLEQKVVKLQLLARFLGFLIQLVYKNSQNDHDNER